MRGQHQRQSDRRNRERRPDRRPRAEPRHRLAGEQRRDHGRRKNEIDEAEIHPPERQWRAHQHEIDEREGADEGEQDAEADRKGRAQRRVRQCAIVAAKGDCVVRHRMHRLDALDGEVHQHRAGEIEQREEVEIRGQPELSATAADTSRPIRLLATLPVM